MIPNHSKLAPGAVYFGDNGRTLCIGCATHTAHGGRDLSGQRLVRATVADAREWRAMCREVALGGEDLGPLACGCGKVTLTEIAGPDGWPMAR